MGLLDIVGQLAGGALNEYPFDQAAQAAPSGALAGGLAAMFKSDQTEAIGQLVGQLFAHSDPQQRAGALNQILATLGPVAASALAGGALGKVLSPGATSVTADQAAALSPEVVGQIVDHADQSHGGGVADTLASFYAEHAGLIKTLGGVAVTVAMAHMKERSTQQS